MLRPGLLPVLQGTFLLSNMPFQHRIGIALPDCAFEKGRFSLIPSSYQDSSGTEHILYMGFKPVLCTLTVQQHHLPCLCRP